MKTLISGKTVLLSTILSCVMAQIREVQQKIEIEWPKQAGGIYTIATITKKKQKNKTVQCYQQLSLSSPVVSEVTAPW